MCTCVRAPVLVSSRPMPVTAYQRPSYVPGAPGALSFLSPPNPGGCGVRKSLAQPRSVGRGSACPGQSRGAVLMGHPF